MDGVLLPAGSIAGKVGRSWLTIGLGGPLTAVLAPCGGGICNVGALRELLPEPDALAIWSGLTPVLAICASNTVRKSQTGSTFFFCHIHAPGQYREKELGELSKYRIN